MCNLGHRRFCFHLYKTYSLGRRRFRVCPKPIIIAAGVFFVFVHPKQIFVAAGASVFVCLIFAAGVFVVVYIKPILLAAGAFVFVRNRSSLPQVFVIFVRQDRSSWPQALLFLFV